MKRRDAVIALFAIGAVPLRSLAQQLRRIPRVGILGVTTAAGYAAQIEALRQGLRDRGYVEGRNLVIEYRWADGQRERLPALAAELVRLQPDILLTSGAGTRALKEATATIPIVMAAGGDAVATGLVASLAQPGGNITGSTFFGPEIAAKCLELLKEAVPRLARVAVLAMKDGRAARAYLEPMKKTAAALKVELIEVPARSPNEFNDVFALMVRGRVDGLVVLDDSMLVANMRRLGELSVEKHLPGAGSAEYAEGGGLLTYAVNFPELWHRASYFVDRILKGEMPATMPVERAAKFALTINLKTAAALGLAIPQSLLVRADEMLR